MSEAVSDDELLVGVDALAKIVTQSNGVDWDGLSPVGRWQCRQSVLLGARAVLDAVGPMIARRCFDEGAHTAGRIDVDNPYPEPSL